MPTKCCPNCFGDRELEVNIFNTLELSEGTCSFCKTFSAKLADPSGLREVFELLVSSYEEDVDGEITIVEWLMEDWLLFDCPSINLNDAKQLLAEILDDGEITRRPVKPTAAHQTTGLTNWETLKDELRYKNRYFLDEELNQDRLGELLDYLISDPLPEEWFRARIMSDEVPYELSKMGAPPKGIASYGRANPSGIPYLYVASCPQTALAEIRPNTGDLATVAKFRIPADAKIVDLRNPKKLVSPLILGDANDIAKLRLDIPFLAKLGDELTRPVLPRSAAIDYVPSQFLCEFIKKRGFSGVLYSSSLSGGVNLALFDVGSVTGIEVSTYKVIKVSVEISEER